MLSRVHVCLQTSSLLMWCTGLQLMDRGALDGLSPREEFHAPSGNKTRPCVVLDSHTTNLPPRRTSAFGRCLPQPLPLMPLAVPRLRGPAPTSYASLAARSHTVVPAHTSLAQKEGPVKASGVPAGKDIGRASVMERAALQRYQSATAVPVTHAKWARNPPQRKPSLLEHGKQLKPQHAYKQDSDTQPLVNMESHDSGTAHAQLSRCEGLQSFAQHVRALKGQS